MIRKKGESMKLAHDVKLHSMGNCVYLEWNGFSGRHDYMMAEDLEDLDILLSELMMALLNYKCKQIAQFKVKKK